MPRTLAEALMPSCNTCPDGMSANANRIRPMLGNLAHGYGQNWGRYEKQFALRRRDITIGHNSVQIGTWVVRRHGRLADVPTRLVCVG